MNNSQTPRTDAATERVWHGAPAVMIYKHPAGGATIRTDEAESTYMVPADLARQLERENAELRAALSALYHIVEEDEGDNEGWWSEPFRTAMYAARSLVNPSHAQGGAQE